MTSFRKDEDTIIRLATSYVLGDRFRTVKSRRMFAISITCDILPHLTISKVSPMEISLQYLHCCSSYQRKIARGLEKVIPCTFDLIIKAKLIATPHSIGKICLSGHRHYHYSEFTATKTTCIFRCIFHITTHIQNYFYFYRNVIHMT